MTILDAMNTVENTRDEILLEGMRFYAFHGVHPEEQSRGQRFLVDVVLAVDTRRAGETDDLNQTVNYSEVHRTVREVVEGGPRKLIEAVAEDIARAVLNGFPLVQQLTVTVRKPEVGIKHAFLESVGVRIKRRRGGTT